MREYIVLEVALIVFTFIIIFRETHDLTKSLLVSLAIGKIVLITFAIWGIDIPLFILRIGRFRVTVTATTMTLTSYLIADITTWFMPKIIKKAEAVIS